MNRPFLATLKSCKSNISSRRLPLNGLSELLLCLPFKPLQKVQPAWNRAEITLCRGNHLWAEALTMKVVFAAASCRGKKQVCPFPSPLFLFPASCHWISAGESGWRESQAWDGWSGSKLSVHCDTHTPGTSLKHLRSLILKTEKTRLIWIVCLDSEFWKYVVCNPNWVGWHACNFSSREMGVGGSRIQGYLQLHSVFKTNLRDRMPSYRRR